MCGTYLLQPKEGTGVVGRSMCRLHPFSHCQPTNQPSSFTFMQFHIKFILNKFN